MKVIDAPTLKNKNVEENLLIEWYVHSLFFFFFSISNTEKWTEKSTHLVFFELSK